MRTVQLVRGNDWGMRFLMVRGSGSEGDSRLAVRFAEGEWVKIEWPDGTQTVERITLRVEKGSAGDHGHTYSTEFKIPGIEADVHGVKVWVPLDTKDLRVRINETHEPEPQR